MSGKDRAEREGSRRTSIYICTHMYIGLFFQLVFEQFEEYHIMEAIEIIVPQKIYEICTTSGLSDGVYNLLNEEALRISRADVALPSLFCG